MRIVPLLVLLLAAPPLAAQQPLLSVEPAVVVKEILLDGLDEDYEDVTVVSVTNNGRRSIQILQQVAALSTPRAWRLSSFRRNGLTAPYPATTHRTTRLAPGESALVQVTLRPDGTPGSGRAEVRFSDITSPGVIIGRASIATKIVLKTPEELGLGDPAELARRRPVPTTTNVFPNPAPEAFFVETPPGQRVGRVEVSNSLGRLLKRFDRPAGEAGYDIEALPDGLYLITVYDGAGNKIKTVRLLHRRYGA